MTGIVAAEQRLQLVRCIDAARWDSFLLTSPQYTLFCRSDFLQALGIPHELWLLVEGEKPLAGAVVVLEEGGQPRIGSFPFTLFHGVVLGAWAEDRPLHSRVPETLRILERLLAGLEEVYPRLWFCLHPTIADLRAFSWFHYHEPQKGQFGLELRYTGWIDLASVPDFTAFLGSVRKVRRYEYRRAQRQGLTVETSADLEALLCLYRRTFERQTLPVTGETEEHLRRLAAAALAHGFGELLVCRDSEGEPAAACLFLFDERCAYYIVGANDPRFRADGSGTFTVLESVRRCHERGIPWVDVCGMNSPNRGDFKASLNAAPIPYYMAAWQRGPDQAKPGMYSHE